MSTASTTEMVNLTIDGKAVQVPKGTNLIEAAKMAGHDIPYYCYHPHLSIAGNCRMCQVKIKGMPKMEIACNTVVREGMEVQTHRSSPEVADTQASVLEFLLINHPLDCTVCDQAGHCKLQDYHYDYNAKPSRFLEEKETKVKAEELGPTVMLDGERCIACTRCVRFCDEVTGTTELGMLNRGDRYVISTAPGKPLDNPLSGTVVDLCPVGALTHKNWRFNSRIWFTEQSDGVCPGCSTGCNTKVFSRQKEREIIQVKARLNEAVNKEWMCDEGRYGFHRFQPQHRIRSASVLGERVDTATALKELSSSSGKTAIVLAPDLLLEEYLFLRQHLDRIAGGALVTVRFGERTLSAVEKILVSPDRAPNFQGFNFAGLGEAGESAYRAALERIRSGEFERIVVLGDQAILADDLDSTLAAALKKARTFAVITDATSPLIGCARTVIPGRTVIEKSGLLINRSKRLQYSNRVFEPLAESEPEWSVLRGWVQARGGSVPQINSDRELTMWALQQDPRLAGLSIAQIKGEGVVLASSTAPSAAATGVTEARV